MDMIEIKSLLDLCYKAIEVHAPHGEGKHSLLNRIEQFIADIDQHIGHVNELPDNRLFALYCSISTAFTNAYFLEEDYYPGNFEAMFQNAFEASNTALSVYEKGIKENNGE